LKQQVDFSSDLDEEKELGIFWICYDDFLEFFKVIDICKYENGFWRSNEVYSDDFRAFKF
jgi:hypothetical protein